jgi:NitT/TauT family transport system ATP-binding protein
VGFARALAVEPDVLLMDEPFSALDVLTAESLRGELMDLWRNRRIPTRAILIVTHNIEEAVLLADRVLLLGANPGHVRTEILLELPRPRSREDPAIQAQVDRLYQLMTRPDTPDESRRITPVRAALAPLPHARLGALTGLLEFLEDRGGREDLHRLASDLQFEVDDLLPLMDAAVLFGLARVEEGDALLTAEGTAFAQASTLQRKELFRVILTRTPTLVARIYAALCAKKNRRLPEGFFLDLFEEHFSAAEARRQLDTAIQWGRFAELFEYDADTGGLILETSASAPKA